MTTAVDPALAEAVESVYRRRGLTMAGVWLIILALDLILWAVIVWLIWVLS